MPAITISASYGAGGSAVAPLVATQLGWPLVDRALSSTVADSLAMPLEDVERGGGEPSRLTRFLHSLAGFAPAPLTPDDQGDADEAEVRRETELRLREAAASGAVILGRAGACALGDDPSVLRVRLYGPVEARTAQAARLEHISAEAAADRQRQVDRARADYVRRLYGRSADDPLLYHLQVDSTVLPLPGVAALILTAFERLTSR